MNRYSDVTEGVEGFTVVVYADNARASVLPRGELDLASAGELESTLSGLRGQGFKFVQVDLGGITFMDTAGLNVLLREHQAFQARRGRLILRNPSRQARRLLHVTATMDVLSVAD